MENAVDALKIAFGVLVFVIALTVACALLSQAKATSDGSDIANGWFVGFTPYKDPEVAVVVILEDGAKDSFAAKTARKILEAYYNIDTNEDSEQENTKASSYAETQR